MNHKTDNTKSGQTALQAFRMARRTNTIRITNTTIALLEAAAKFNDAANEFMDSVTEYIPETMRDNDTIDAITNDFYEHLDSAQQSAYASIGKAILTELFSTVKFKGL